jgi:predicted DNA binding CopG/RHH family protein
MRQQNNGRRRQSRGPVRRSYGTGNINKNSVIDSAGPDSRQRGTAVQLHEKYSSLASDATASDDRILAESYRQFSDHYYRLNKEIELISEARESRVNAEKEVNENKTNNLPEPTVDQNSTNRPPRRQRGFQAREKELSPKDQNVELKVEENNIKQVENNNKTNDLPESIVDQASANIPPKRQRPFQARKKELLTKNNNTELRAEENDLNQVETEPQLDIK